MADERSAILRYLDNLSSMLHSAVGAGRDYGPKGSAAAPNQEEAQALSPLDPVLAHSLNLRPYPGIYKDYLGSHGEDFVRAAITLAPMGAGSRGAAGIGRDAVMAHRLDPRRLGYATDDIGGPRADTLSNFAPRAMRTPENIADNFDPVFIGARTGKRYYGPDTPANMNAGENPYGAPPQSVVRRAPFEVIPGGKPAPSQFSHFDPLNPYER